MEPLTIKSNVPGSHRELTFYSNSNKGMNITFSDIDLSKPVDISEDDARRIYKWLGKKLSQPPDFAQQVDIVEESPVWQAIRQLQERVSSIESKSLRWEQDADDRRGMLPSERKRREEQESRLEQPQGDEGIALDRHGVELRSADVLVLEHPHSGVIEKGILVKPSLGLLEVVASNGRTERWNPDLTSLLRRAKIAEATRVGE